ncbi:hypothetical protein D0869_08078 [Hortaea werneckii]|uniref:RNA polymerase I-specific transcription initiation factor RRN6-like protein n=1 Tax=Hortaea werneckii TaxID=91943 RepID=A0A3M6XTA5_HORWE|nr:hypothetical protein D0869_08078 [Hortaea werneckii]RMX94012.1 hypothetical protein D0868_12530 [Hortaea werneckii]RMY17387.1 hypothetical protein D0867_06064 [Hortaea werneckii]RMY35173.1 hypothetical protein D0866_04781 [Hortaea werneckii]
MADQARHGLSYGHFGLAAYDLDESKWHFTRNPQPGANLIPIGEPEQLSEPSVFSHSKDDTESLHQAPSIENARRGRDCAKSLPEVQPASDLLRPSLRVSEGVQSATSRNDPLRGGLLALGDIPSEASRHSIGTIAFACGRTGSEIRLAELRMQRQGWSDTKDVWIYVPTIYGDSAHWHSGGSPIQQVCFANIQEGKSAFLAVRLLTRLVIFRPILRDHPSQSSSGSSLDMNTIFELPISMTGAESYADVAFNGWYNRQFGVVDQIGSWSVWELYGRKGNKAKCIAASALAFERNRSSSVTNDGWARFRWICSPTVIAIANRAKVVLHEISSESKLSPSKTFEIEASQHWILDLAAPLSYPNYLCLLTAQRLVIYIVRCDDDVGLSATAILDLKHFKNPEDTTLSLTTLGDDGDLIVLLHSKTDPATLKFEFHVNDDGTLTANNPSFADFPNHHHGFYLSRIMRKKKESEDEDGSALQLESSATEFYNSFALDHALCLRTQLLSTYSYSKCGHHVTPPTWKARLPAKSSTRLPKEEFVLDDEENAVEYEPRKTRPTSAFVLHRKALASRRNRSGWTVPFEFTAQTLNKRLSELSLDIFVNASTNVLRQQDPDTVIPSQTLRDLRDGAVTVGDIEAMSSQLQNLAVAGVKTQGTKSEAPEEYSLQLVLRHVRNHTVSSSQAEASELNLADVYNQMIDDYISPLPSTISGRTRLAKENIMRSAAADVALASRFIRAEEREQPTQEVQESQQQNWELPVRFGADVASSQLLPSSQAYDSSSQVQHPQRSILPTPSPSATPSVTTASSGTSIFAPEASRLARVTSFSKPTPSALPRSLRNVLAHWPPDEDPDNYDWVKTSRRIRHADEAFEDEAGMTEKERLRLQRRAERHIRRQRKEAAASQAAQIASSQAPEIAVSASQPRADKVESQPVGLAASSQIQDRGVPSASQMVPGRFGGRPAKKKRKQGF